MCSLNKRFLDPKAKINWINKTRPPALISLIERNETKTKILPSYLKKNRKD